MKASPNQTSFNGGELSDLMSGRVDFDRLKSSLKVSLNAFGMLQGPWTRRPGSYFCDEVKDSSKPTRSVRFKFSTGQQYTLEFGHFYVRFKKNRAPVYDLSLTITNVTNGNPAVFTYAGTDPANGDHLDIEGIVGMEPMTGLRVVVSNVNAGANTFEAKFLDGTPVNTSPGGYGAYISGGVANRVYTLTTPYDSADLFQLKFTRQLDRIYIFHVDYPEASLNRLADANWTHTPLAFLDGPYLPLNKVTATTMGISVATPGTGRTVTASAVTGINDDQGFLVTDIGRYIRRKSGGVWGYAVITGWTSTTVVTVTVINTWTNIAANPDWRMGLLSDTTGYSACGTFFGDRLYIAGCPYRDSRLDGSRTGDYLNFAETETDGSQVASHAVSYTLNSDESQAVRWMKGTNNGITVGTKEGEWLVTPSSLGEAITPTNINAKQSTPYGSADIDAERVGSAVLFPQFGARRIREMTFLAYENTLQSPDMTALAEHVTKGPSNLLSGVVELAYQKERVPILWMPRKDGVLLSFVYSREDKVMGWARHLYGGYSDAGQTLPAKVESACVVPSEDEAYDELWTVVQRYVNGRIVRYNEFLTNIWEKGNAQEDAHFVDCGIAYEGAPVSVVYGMHHLVGQTVQVLIDGATHPNVVVASNGSVTLQRAGSKIKLGFAYDSDGQCLRPEAGAADGTAQGKIQRTYRCTFRLLDAGPMQVGPSFSKLKSLPQRTAAHPTGQAPPLFNGDRNDFSWDGDYTTENYICWRYNAPLPGTVLSIMPNLETIDR